MANMNVDASSPGAPSIPQLCGPEDWAEWHESLRAMMQASGNWKLLIGEELKPKTGDFVNNSNGYQKQLNFWQSRQEILVEILTGRIDADMAQELRRYQENYHSQATGGDWNATSMYTALKTLVGP